MLDQVIVSVLLIAACLLVYQTCLSEADAKPRGEPPARIGE